MLGTHNTTTSKVLPVIISALQMVKRGKKSSLDPKVTNLFDQTLTPGPLSAND